MDLYKRIGSYKLLTAEQEQVLARRVAAGDNEAVNDLVLANLRLVRATVRRLRICNESYEDFVSEGQVALVNAARRFLPDQAKFSTFATVTIERHLLSYMVANRSLITYSRNGYWVGSKAEREIYKSFGGMTAEQAAEAIAPGCNKTRLKVLSFLGMPKRISSTSPGYITAVSKSACVHDELAAEETVRVVMEAIAGLDKRDRFVVVNRIFNGRTLQAIGDELGVSKERTRQIEFAAFEKLRTTLDGVI